MNFFEHQDRARGTTRKLVVLFSLALASLIFITTFLVVAVFSATDAAQGQPGLNQTFVTSDVFLAVSAGVLAVVLLGTMFRMAQLRGGGRVVAESLGGRVLNLHTRDADERKILNVVEEMAIASGRPVPPVYLIDDHTINAFAAGFKQEDAVIGVTRGCIQLLDREELQGVIAHEFSHINNGDMRLNIRLIGWLYGIMVIGMIGYFILRGSMYSGGNRKGSNKGALVFVALGLVVIGYGGTFFGNLIKAAVSRQREFLADASAVQYTRNPGGIAGALKKIAMHTDGALLSSPKADELSHLFFGQGVRTGFTGLFATHPPLTERIRRIQPRWDGRFDSPQAKPERTPSDAGTTKPHGLSRGLTALQAAGSIVAGVGVVSSEQLQQAATHLSAVPRSLQEETHNTLGACLLMHCLIIASTAEAIRQKQLGFLQQNLQAGPFEQCQRLLAQVQGLPRNQYLTLLELSLPSLKQLSVQQSVTFLSYAKKLIEADAEVSLFEWCVFRILQQHLQVKVRRTAANKELSRCREACEVLLSALCYAGNREQSKVAAAFAAGCAVLEEPTGLRLRSRAENTLEALEVSLDTLQAIKPLQKPRLLKAVVAGIVSDGVLEPAEGELLRAVAAVLDCPVPPLS